MSSQFNTCAQEYHNFRPEYPDELFQFLVDRFQLTADKLVIDVGCGTARATLPLAARGARLIGLDPSLQMLKLGHETARATNVEIGFIQCSAEAIGISDGCAHLINCAQAFHWFDAPTALREFRRLLVAGGGVALYWNNRDEQTAPYLADFERLIVKYNPKHNLAYRDRDWGAAIAESGLFGNIEAHTFRHASEVSIDDLVGLARSFSYVRNVLSATELGDFERELRELLAAASSTGRLLLPYRVELWLATAKDS